MKKGALIIFIFLFIAAAGLLALNARRPAVVTLAEVTPTPTVTLKAEGVTKYIKSPRNFRSAISSIGYSESGTFNKECVEYLSRLEAMNLSQLGTPNAKLTYRGLPEKPEKCAWTDPFLDRMQKDFQKVCKQTLNRKAPKPKEEDVSLHGTISDDCSEKLFFMRAAVTRHILQEKQLAEINDLQQLVDLLYTEFVITDKNTPLNHPRIQALSERILELNPALYVAAKTAAYATATEAVLASRNPSVDESTRNALWKKTELALARTEDLKPRDSEMEDARAALITLGFDPEKTLDYTNAYISKYPSEARGYFLKAYAEWKKGSRDASLENLAKAIEREPTNLSYQELMTELKKPDAKPESFQGEFKFGVSTEDFKEKAKEQAPPIVF